MRISLMLLLVKPVNENLKNNMSYKRIMFNSIKKTASSQEAALLSYL